MRIRKRPTGRSTVVATQLSRSIKITSAQRARVNSKVLIIGTPGKSLLVFLDVYFSFVPVSMTVTLQFKVVLGLITTFITIAKITDHTLLISLSNLRCPDT